MTLLSRLTALTVIGVVAMPALPAAADELDDIIALGMLRCVVVLDFPPMGSRAANNEPVGFDVGYGSELASATTSSPRTTNSPEPKAFGAISSTIDLPRSS